jgi:hypothetical protein
MQRLERKQASASFVQSSFYGACRRDAQATCEQFSPPAARAFAGEAGGDGALRGWRHAIFLTVIPDIAKRLSGTHRAAPPWIPGSRLRRAPE